MMLQKWNPEKRCYEPYSVPGEWNIPLLCDSESEIINCAQCGKRIAYGQSYTSRQVHTLYGLGYGVCGDCNKRELEEERRNRG